MKKTLALLLALCLLLPCAAACADAAETKEVTLHDYRYHYEHVYMTQPFYENPDRVMNIIYQYGAYQLWFDFMQNNDTDPVYAKEDFSETVIPQEDGGYLMRITLPKPEESLECSRLYLYWNPTTSEAGYYTVEYDNFFGETWFLCGWDKDHNHQNYGGAAPLPDPSDPGYQDALDAEAAEVLKQPKESVTIVTESGQDSQE